MESVIGALRHLPSRSETVVERRRERARETQVIGRRINELMRQTASVRVDIEAAMKEINGEPGLPASFDPLDQMLTSQSYRLASWKVAVEEINYRRFSDVNDLAAIRMELPAVFERAHALVFRLIEDRRVNGLRLDHTDGLYDPYAYLEALQKRFVPENGDPIHSPDDLARPLPLLVEKILARGETLPSTWPVDVTTGYDFAAAVTGLWVDGQAERAMTALYREITSDTRSFAEHVYESKQHVLTHTLVSEIYVLTLRLQRIAMRHRRFRDFTLLSLLHVLKEVVSAFPAYRTYLRDAPERRDSDVHLIRAAVRLARRRNASLSASVFDFVEQQLLGGTPDDQTEPADRHAFVLPFQQLTAPITAKAVEDTAFYRYARLICLNEVGGHPTRFGTSVEQFHAANEERARSWPLSMTTTSTHDTKRGEDAAARIAVLSELPREWGRTVRRWIEFANAAVRGAPQEFAPPPTLQYQLFQTLVGAWPFGWDGRTRIVQFVQRLNAYALKASREAKERTSWLNPDLEYEKALSEFVERLFENDFFIADARGFCKHIEIYGDGACHFCDR